MSQITVQFGGRPIVISYGENTGLAAGFAEQASAAAALAEEKAQDAAETSHDLRYRLATIQTIGHETVTSGTTAAGQGTYTFGQALTNSGKGFRLTYEGKGTGTAYFQLSTHVGITTTIDAEYAFSVTPGVNVVEFPNVEFSAGQLTGYRSLSGLIGLTVGTGDGFGGYYSAGTQVSAGNSYDDAGAANADFKIKIEALSQPITGEGYEALQSHVGQDNPEAHRIGLPEGVAPATGSAVGVASYVFDNPAPFDGILSSLDGFSLTPGDYALYRYNLISGTMTAVAVAAATVSISDAGAFSTTDVPEFEMLEGEYLGIASLGGKYSLTPAGGNPTPYWAGPADGSSFAVGAPTSTLTFNFAASFVPKTLSTRVAKLEANSGGAVTAYPHKTKAFHLVWTLGESHAAGRASTFSSNIPDGRGYKYDRATTSIMHLEDPTGSGGTFGSWGPPIGQAMLDTTHGAVGALIVNSGHGGTTVADWAGAGGSWTQAKADWDNAVAAAKAAEIPIAGVTIDICIGTNDMYAGTTKATFKAGLIDLISRAQAYVEAGANVPVALVMIPPYVDSSYDAAVLLIQEAIAEAAREEANVYLATSAPKFADEYGWMKSDQIHLNQTGNDAIGPAIAAVALAHGAGLYPVGLE